MVSNLTTILQCCFIKCPMTSVLSQFAVSTVAASMGFFCYVSICHCKTCLNYRGAPWVGSNLEMWSCPTGYRPSYFVLEGGKGVGRSVRESQAPLLCRSTPRALAEDWWSARLELSSWPLHHYAKRVLMHTCIRFFFYIWLIIEISPSWLSFLISTAIE